MVVAMGAVGAVDVAIIVVVIVVPADHSGRPGHSLADQGVGFLCRSRFSFVPTILGGESCESLSMSTVLCRLAGWTCCC